MEIIWRFPGKLKIEFTYPDNSFLGTLKSTYHRDSNTSLFISTLFTVSRKWSQPRFLPTVNVVHVHNEIVFILEGKFNCDTYRKMDGTRNHYFKQSKPD